MKVSKALTLRAALKSCDGYTKIVNEGGQDKTVFVLHDMNFNTRFTLAKNCQELDKVFDLYSENRTNLIKSIAPDGIGINPKEQPEAFAKFCAEEMALLDSDVEVAIEKIAKKDVENAAFPPSILAQMLEIIE